MGGCSILLGFRIEKKNLLNSDNVWAKHLKSSDKSFGTRVYLGFYFLGFLDELVFIKRESLSSFHFLICRTVGVNNRMLAFIGLTILVPFGVSLSL